MNFSRSFEVDDGMWVHDKEA